MRDRLPVEDHAEPAIVPLGDDQLGLVAGDAWGHRVPAAARRRDRLERQPAPIPHLDRVPAVPGGQPLQNPALAEGGVQAELQGDAPPEPSAQVRADVAQEGDSLRGVMDVAGAILEPEDVPSLGPVGDQPSRLMRN